MKIRNTVLVSVLVTFSVLGMSGTVFAATAVDLGTAGSFAVLGGSTITNTGPTIVNGDLGLSPGTSVTGFPPGIVNGAQHITDAVAAQAEADLVTAYNAASGQSTGVTMVSGDLGGQTLIPGLYKSASSLGLTGTLTLDAQGNPDAVFIFQLGSALTTASASRVTLVGGTQACNVFWQIGSSATLGTNSNFVGTIIALSSVTVNTGSSIEGRVLARNGAVTLDTSPINRPTCAAPAVIVTPTPPPVLPPAPTPPPVVVPVTVSTPALPPVGGQPLSVTPPAANPVVTMVVNPLPTLALAPPVTSLTPDFPNTGFPPEKGSTPWTTSVLAGILFGALISFAVAPRLRQGFGGQVKKRAI
ncbi:MAG: ice-binding family protein [bacterium]|nr:ice-binding family protein [bacterium]